MLNTAVHGLLAFVLVVFFIYLLKPLAHRVGLVDKPGGRKIHKGSIPLIGGIAIYMGFTFAMLSLPISLNFYRSFVAASALLVIVGILDDFHELSAKARLFAQILAGLLMTIWGGVYFKTLGMMFGMEPIALGIMSIPFTIFSTVAMINAVNMTDGVDGLAGGLCLVELFFVALLAGLSHHWDLVAISTTLMAALLGFLCFNYPYYPSRKAKIFLGDSGSMFLGFAITWFVVDMAQGQHRAMAPVTILWILAIHIFDIVTVTYRRLFQRQSPLLAAQDHIHHLLNSFGINPFFCSLLLCTVSLLMGTIGILGYLLHIPDVVMFVGFLIGFGIYSVIVNCLWVLKVKQQRQSAIKNPH
jgi:UDP-GlcNAc:undecaprenyl-phosphate GlcNAc-1-phosphate transferase